MSRLEKIYKECKSRSICSRCPYTNICNGHDRDPFIICAPSRHTTSKDFIKEYTRNKLSLL